MNNITKFSCILDTTDSSCALGMEIWLDDQQIFNNNHVSNQITVEHEFSDTDSEHELKFILKGKQPEHTCIDQQGNIISDARLIIKEIKFDEIALGYMFTELAGYTHDFNGTGQLMQDKFYGEMGCNGTVSLKFSTPIYLWLLEHM